MGSVKDLRLGTSKVDISKGLDSGRQVAPIDIVAGSGELF